MFSMFSKTHTEPKAADILQHYSNVDAMAHFRDTQAIYMDLVDHFNGGAQARVSV